LQGPVAVLLNGGGGTAARMGQDEMRRHLIAAFARHGIAVEPLVLEGGELGRVAREKLTTGPSGRNYAAIVAGGGDGTMNAVAQILAGSETPLGILPLGTLNHFARDLGVPLDLDEAVAAIAGGHIVEVDLGEVNGRVFVNNSSIGLYPALIRDRDRQRRKSRRHKILAVAVALAHVLRHLPVRRLRIEAEGWVRPHKALFAFIGNNLYTTDLFATRHRAKLSDGELCLFVASPSGIFGIVRMLLRAALGRLDQDSDFETRRLRELTIHSRRHRLSVSLDGEVAVLHPPLRYRSRPRALRVLVPATETGS
jgi:diacylglycerol kinase family enzyme